MQRNKQVEAAEEAQAAYTKAMEDDASYMTTTERAKAERMKLYHTLKAHGSLDVYYHLYPDERPRPKQDQAELEQSREREGRGR